MKRDKWTETVTETREVLTVRRGRGAPAVWCPACAQVTRMVRPEWAAAAAALSGRELYRRVEAGRLHGAEAPDGSLLICLNSLADIGCRGKGK